jgi:enamine deaminase RidA (YjgF/YER057c/UK114 family)
MILRLPGSVSSRSRGVVHNGSIYAVAVARDKVESHYEQTKQALAAIDATLAEAGTDKSRILTAFVFISDMNKKEEMNRAWEEWVDLKNPPMRACLGVILEGNDLVEIVVTAAK